MKSNLLRVILLDDLDLEQSAMPTTHIGTEYDFDTFLKVLKMLLPHTE